MSELKAFELKVGKNLETDSPLVVGVDNKWNSRIMSGEEVYLKPEADKVIAEKDAEIAQLQAMLEERNKQVGELKEERRWRKFIDEKPEDEGDYLVMARYPDDDEPHIEICFYDRHGEDFGHYERRYAGSGNFFGGFDGEEWITHNVSFWMPLPKAQEGK